MDDAVPQLKTPEDLLKNMNRYFKAGEGYYYIKNSIFSGTLKGDRDKEVEKMRTDLEKIHQCKIGLGRENTAGLRSHEEFLNDFEKLKADSKLDNKAFRQPNQQVKMLTPVYEQLEDDINKIESDRTELFKYMNIMINKMIQRKKKNQDEEFFT
jgi:hypothetical protein